MTNEAASPGALADVLRARIKQSRISIAHVVRVSGVARHTIELILNGTTKDPQRATLRALARGVASDPHSLEIDERLRGEIERDLLVASGYAAGSAAAAGSLLRLALWLRFGSWAKADAWLDAIERLSDLAVRDVRVLGSPRRERQTSASSCDECRDPDGPSRRRPGRDEKRTKC